MTHYQTEVYFCCPSASICLIIFVNDPSGGLEKMLMK